MRRPTRTTGRIPPLPHEQRLRGKLTFSMTQLETMDGGPKKERCRPRRTRCSSTSTAGCGSTATVRRRC
jgi:hypothetical protein